MSSLASSLAFSTPTKLTTPFLPRALHSTEPQLPPPPKITSSAQLLLGSSALISRRNLLGLGIISGGLLLLRPEAAPAAKGGACEFTVAPSGLGFCDRTLGDGPQPSKGQLIKAHYVGKLENGKVFDSSYNRGKPLSFKIGVGEVIKGWDEGILGGEGVPPMLPGGKRTLKIPPQLGYGMRGAGCRGGSCIIPPDSVLFFDVEYMARHDIYVQVALLFACPRWKRPRCLYVPPLLLQRFETSRKVSDSSALDGNCHGCN